MTEDALEAQAHNAAKRLGLIAIKSSEDVDNASNFGGFQLIDPQSHCVAGCLAKAWSFHLPGAIWSN
jgi:hypothetical protein